LPAIANYLLSIAPAFLVFAALLAIVPQAFSLLRIILSILFFVLARDAMTPQGFWLLAPGALRFTAPPAVLLTLGAMSLGLVGSTFWVERASRGNVKWTGPKLYSSALLGLGGALLISLVAASLKRAFDLPSLPAPDSGSLLTILAFALAGNAYEEFLFRGLLQGEIAKQIAPIKAALISGLIFCFCHSFLATTVTHIGAPILVFTLIEGIVAGLVCIRGGVFGSTLTHGGAIFILSSGFY
jgi:membrane protease YdiL (CAAX protease family)